MSLPLVTPLDPAPNSEYVAARLLDLPYVTWLDSAATGDYGRYSFVAADPAIVVRSRGKVTERLISPGGAWEVIPGDALDEVHRWLGAPVAPVPELPPFQGGAAGYIGYDYGAVLERLPSPRHDDLAVPDVVLGLYDWVIAWDHERGRAWLVSTGLPEAGPARAERAAHRRDVILRRLSGGPCTAPTLPPFTRGEPAPSWPVIGVDRAEAIGLRSTFTHRAYLSAVARTREYILAGDIFQANISQRLEAPLPAPPFELYRALRRRNPASFAAYLAFDDLAVMSASPERFLQLDERGQVETRPIKGTRPRGLGPMHDAMLGRELSESEKDRSENVMIVDLLRNDLSRVCRPGSVQVPALCALERHPTVYHLVSTVVGHLSPGRSAADLLRASFPGGSITGAPKVRAMEIIAELEPTRRGVYCGSIGYLSVTGAMDTSIVIRTFVARGDRVYFQAGGGIVADSEPESEYRETLDKARGLIAALEAAT